MRIKLLRNLTVGLALAAMVALVGYKFGYEMRDREVVVSEGSPVDLGMMGRVRQKLEELYLERDKMNDSDMSYGAIKGMVDSLGDPYTVFLPPKENKASNEDLAGEFGGVGISLGYKDKTLAVMSPLPKTPADEAGVLAGDLILKITDKERDIDRDTTGITLDEAVSLIRGPIGSKVTLKMFREGKDAAYDVTLTRENIVVASIELEFKENAGKKVAWIKLYKFTERLYEEWEDIVNQVLSEKQKGNLSGIVLDLRNNPGGYLQASVSVASDFLEPGLIVVEQQSSDGSVETYKSEKKKSRLVGIKSVVLINGGSASASEILAGALQEHKVAKLVGEKSFGKGTVQQPEDFSDGSGLHVTIAKWLLPNGKNIHKEGVMPDVEEKYVADEKDKEADNQLNKAIETLKSL